MSSKSKSLIKKCDIVLTLNQIKVLADFLSQSIKKTEELLSKTDLFMINVNGDKYILVPHEKGTLSFQRKKYIPICPAPSKEPNESIKSTPYRLTDNQKTMLTELLNLGEDESLRLFGNIEMELAENYNPSGNLANKKEAKLSENKKQLEKLSNKLLEIGNLYSEIDNSIIQDIETNFNMDIEVLTGIEEFLENNRVYTEKLYLKKVTSIDIIASLIQCINNKIKLIEDSGYTSKYNDLIIEKLFKAWWLSEIPHKITSTNQGKFAKYVYVIMYLNSTVDGEYSWGDYEKDSQKCGNLIIPRMYSISKAIQRCEMLKQNRAISLDDFLQDKNIKYLK